MKIHIFEWEIKRLDVTSWRDGGVETIIPHEIDVKFLINNRIEASCTLLYDEKYNDLKEIEKEIIKQIKG